MKKLLCCGLLAAAASGCVMVGKTNACAPIELDVQSPDTAFIDNSVKPIKQGTATASGIILFVDGDASLKAAMDQGGIKKIHHVDYKVKNVFGIVGSTTTIVWGE